MRPDASSGPLALLRVIFVELWELGSVLDGEPVWVDPDWFINLIIPVEVEIAGKGCN